MPYVDLIDSSNGDRLNIAAGNMISGVSGISISVVNFTVKNIINVNKRPIQL